MTFSAFIGSVTASGPPPPELAPALAALWFDRAGRWDEAHRVAQDVETPDGAWVHAYLHRKEGDHANAAYWYRRSGRPVATASEDDEWTTIVQTLLTGTRAV
jgi:hypothetical protein